MLCSRKSLVARKFMGEGGNGKEYQEFPPKTFCLTVPKNFVGELFFVSQNFWYRKIFGRSGGGECQEFRSKFFSLNLPGNFVAEPISVSLFLGIDKFYASEGGVTIFCRKIVATQCRKFS